MSLFEKPMFRFKNWNHPILAHTYFTPVVDGFRLNASILPEYPVDLLKRRSPEMPSLIGVTTGECISYVIWLHNLGITTSPFMYPLISASMQKPSKLLVDVVDLDLVVPSMLYANSDQVSFNVPSP